MGPPSQGTWGLAYLTDSPVLWKFVSSYDKVTFKWNRQFSKIASFLHFSGQFIVWFYYHEGFSVWLYFDDYNGAVGQWQGLSSIAFLKK